jgi:hypothetical protein
MMTTPITTTKYLSNSEGSVVEVLIFNLSSILERVSGRNKSSDCKSDETRFVEAKISLARMFPDLEVYLRF